MVIRESGVVLRGACLIALFSASLNGLHAAACSPPASGIVGWWPGEGNANDLIGTNNGFLVGGATASASGMVGTAFSFDGTNSYVQFSDSSVFHPSNLTVEAWIRFSSLDSAGSGSSPAGEQYVIFKQNTRSGDFEGFDLGKERSGGSDHFRFTVSSSSGQSADILSATLVATGVWYHVAGVRGSNFTQLYVNGQLERQTNVSFAQDYGSLPLFFGTSGQSSWDHKFKGLLDEPALYNRALGSNEIAAIYAAGSAGKCGSPRILTQPQGQTVAVGSNASFSVTATGTDPLSYQWQFNGMAIPGATLSSFALANVQSANAGNYTAVITDAGGAFTSSIALLTVLSPPAITADPVSATNLAGSSVSFSAGATGTTPLTYRWLKSGVTLTNGGRLTGANSNILTITNLQSSDAADYALSASNAVGVATSAVATLTVLFPPGIVAQPQSLTVGENSNALFTVTASGSAPLSYQWSFNGNSISGATSPSLSFPASASAAGNYAVIITNQVGAATSSVAVLTVLSPPVITTNPASATNLAGSATSFSGSATGTAPLTYRWLKSGVTLTNGSRFSGIGSNVLTITNLQPSDAGDYALSVSNTAAIATSAVATLTVMVPPAIVAQPQNLTVLEDSNAVFTASASGSVPLSYQWLRNGDAIPGANTSSLSFPAQVSDAGGYTVVVTNQVGVITSSVATLTVLVPPKFYAEPGSSANALGSTAQFSATVAGTAPLAFQWYFNGLTVTNSGRITGAFSNSVSIANLQTNDAGDYWLVVTNIAAAATSSVVHLTVALPPTILTQPSNWNVLTGANVSFFATASGTPPLSFQWEHDGADMKDGNGVSGAGTSNLNLANVQTNDAGNYTVIVSNLAGVVTSAPTMLLVGLTSAPPAITVQPASQILVTGNDAAFSVAASGTFPLTHQWRKFGVNLSDNASVAGATSPQLTLHSVVLADGGSYDVVITNRGGSVTSSVATVTVNQPVLLPADAVVLVNSTSPRYSDFQRYIQPYLENFGVPYVVQNIATNPVGTNLASHALIIIGHRALDTNHLYLNTAAQTIISSAVSNGVGLVNFDTDLAAGTSPRYQFIQDIFGFTYGSSGSTNAIVFTNTQPGLPMHYVTAAHTNGEGVSMRGNISVAGLTLATNDIAVVLAGGRPLVTVAKFGRGRAVQWGSDDWMSVLIMGPVAGLDDVVWRGMVWAGRKPFVLRGFPNFATMRVDDVGGPLWWAHIANEVGFKPFLAVFIYDPAPSTLADLRSCVSNGIVTMCPHAFNNGNFIYFNHQTEAPYSDATISNNYYATAQWHVANGLPLPKIIATHYSEIGTNAFTGLLNWGVEYVPIEVVPGTIEYTNKNPAPWIVAGPYRYYENPLPGQTNLPMYYADWLSIPGHPELTNKFFNCYTEMRDVDPAYGQWYPNNDATSSAARGSAMLKRGFDSMVLSTVFTHDWVIQNTPSGGGPITPITTNSWRAILQAMTNILTPYKPIFVTLEYGNQYARATKTSRISSSLYDSSSGQVQVTLTGKTDLDISVQVFNGEDTAITNAFGTIPAFTNSITATVANIPVAPMLYLGPQSQTNNTGTTAVFPAYAAGSAPLAYRWLKDGTNLLADGGNLTGASSSVLTVSDARGADTGSYALIVSNSFSSVTSAPAILMVVDPLITSQPASRVNHAGTDAQFVVGAAGTQLQYQWSKDAAVLPFATGMSLVVPSVTVADAGSYSVIVSNVFGTVTSSPATLTVTDPLAIQTIIVSNDVSVLQWRAIPGSNYVVQYKDDLAWPAWSNLAIVTATGPTMAITNAAQILQQRFFRVVLE
jgi:hypothetical protein